MTDGSWYNRTMKALFIVTAVIEGGIGLALLASPAVPVSLLFGTELTTPVAFVVARVAGAALLALGMACWLARHDASSRAANGLVAAMLIYNVAAIALLVSAVIGSGLHGVGLWPGVVLHLAMSAWCIRCLWARRDKIDACAGTHPER